MESEVQNLYDTYVELYGKDFVDTRIKNGKCLECGKTKSESEISSLLCLCQGQGGHWIKSSEKEDERRLSIKLTDSNHLQPTCG